MSSRPVANVIGRAAQIAIRMAVRPRQLTSKRRCKPLRNSCVPCATLVDVDAPLSSDANEVISVLGFELGRMLANEGPQYLVQGPDWHTLSADKGTRLEMVVTHLCHCGLKSVQNANKLATRAESAGDKTLKAALPRGRPSQGLPGEVAGKLAGSEVVGRAAEPEQDECFNTLA